MNPPKGAYRQIAEIEELWTLPEDLSDAPEYDPYKARSGWVYIKDVRMKVKDMPPSHSAIKAAEPLWSNSFMDYEPHYIGYDDGEDHIFFQGVGKTTIRKQGRAVFISAGGVIVSDPSDTWFLNGEADAIYDRRTDVVYFKKIWNISRFFPKIRDYGKEYDALSRQFFNCGLFDGSRLGKINRTNLARLQKVNEILGKLNSEQLQAMIEYILEVDNTLYRIDDRIIVNDNHELRNVLDAIEQNVYKAPVTGEIRVALSTVLKTE